MKTREVNRVAVGSALSVLVFCLACQPAPPADVAGAPEAPRDGLFVHISHGPQHSHRVLMGLRMAEMMAPDRDVLVYFDVGGVEVVVEGQSVESEGFDSSARILERLIEANVPVYVCPTCLRKAGKTAEDLIAGVQLGEKDRFFEFTRGRILSLGY